MKVKVRNIMEKDMKFEEFDNVSAVFGEGMIAGVRYYEKDADCVDTPWLSVMVRGEYIAKLENGIGGQDLSIYKKW